jgi:hypothetical protein
LGHTRRVHLRPFPSLLGSLFALAAAAVLAASCGGNVVVDKPGSTTTSECGAGQISCDDECVSPAGDSFNCGYCGNVCAQGFCDNGNCTGGPGCPPGLASCGESCVDLATDSQNCGFCNNVCPPDAVCDGGCQVGGCLCGTFCEIVSLGSDVPQSVSAMVSGLDQATLQCTGFGGPDLVFSFFAPFDGVYTVDTFGSSFDSVLQVMDNGCGVLACNDNAPGGGVASSVVVKLFGGQQVLIVVESVSASVSLQLNINEGEQACAGCAEYINGDQSVPLCPKSEGLYNDLIECVCFGVCGMVCENLCNGGDPSAECQNCVFDGGMGCGKPFNECSNDL